MTFTGASNNNAILPPPPPVRFLRGISNGFRVVLFYFFFFCTHKRNISIGREEKRNGVGVGGGAERVDTIKRIKRFNLYWNVRNASSYTPVTCTIIQDTFKHNITRVDLYLFCSFRNLKRVKFISVRATPRGNIVRTDCILCSGPYTNCHACP